MRDISKVGVNMINDIYDILISDDHLLRLLHYSPKSPKIEPPFLPEDNLVVPSPPPDQPPTPEYLKMWEIVDNHILTTSKSEDLERNSICRIYVYLGKQKPYFNNRFVKRQEVVFDVFCHTSYEQDFRMERILARINDLVSGTRVTGLGRLTLSGGHGFNAPKEYVAYRAIYELGRSR